MKRTVNELTPLGGQEHPRERDGTQNVTGERHGRNGFSHVTKSDFSGKQECSCGGIDANGLAHTAFSWIVSVGSVILFLS